LTEARAAALLVAMVLTVLGQMKMGTRCGLYWLIPRLPPQL